MVVDTCRQRCF